MQQRRLVVEFTKMNGAGNDFIVIDNRFYHFTDEELGAMAQRLCRRRFGIGADGIMAFNPPREPGHDYRMRYVNADGSVGTMCGNGARCLARFARRAGLSKEELIFETDAGIFRAVVADDSDGGPVRLYLDPPQRYEANRRIPSLNAGRTDGGHYIWTGTEHFVCFVDDLEAVPVVEWGRAIRRDRELAPAGANVDFVEVAPNGSDVLRARTYEKGVEDETYACGTGAVAAAVVARLQGRVEGDRIEVQMPGGTLYVGMSVDGPTVSDIYLEGPAESVYRGTVEI